MLQVISHSSLFIIGNVPVSKLKNMNIFAVENKSQLINFMLFCTVHCDTTM